MILPAATKLGQGNVFTGVCDSVHRGGEGVCLSACWDARPPWSRPTPPDRAHPPRPDTPRTRHPPSRHTPRTRHTPPDQAHTPGPGTPPPGANNPPREADASIRSMSGRYASYWSAFLFTLIFRLCLVKNILQAYFFWISAELVSYILQSHVRHFQDTIPEIKVKF